MSKINFSLLLPTRQRPDQLIRLYNSAMNTANKPEQIEIVAYVDDDDVASYKLQLPRLTLIVGPRFHDNKVNLSVKWNKCWEKAKGDYFFHCGDDIVFKTQGWDTMVKEAIDARPGKIAFVWGDDLDDQSQRNEFGTHGFVHRNWTDVVGYFVPPYFVSDYNDTFFNDISRKLNVQTYLHQVKTEHLHFSLGKSAIDKNTEERLRRHELERPDLIYNSPEFQAELEQKREALQRFINENAAT